MFVLMMCRYCEGWWQAAVLPVGSGPWRTSYHCYCRWLLTMA